MTGGTEGSMWKLTSSFFSKPIPENTALCFSRRLLMRSCSSGDTVSVCSFVVWSCIPAAWMLSVIPAMGTSGLLSLSDGRAWCPFLFMARIPSALASLSPSRGSA